MRVSEFRKYTDEEIKHLQDVELMILKGEVCGLKGQTLLWDFHRLF